MSGSIRSSECWQSEHGLCNGVAGIVSGLYATACDCGCHLISSTPENPWPWDSVTYVEGDS